MLLSERVAAGEERRRAGSLRALQGPKSVRLEEVMRGWVVEPKKARKDYRRKMDGAAGRRGGDATW